MTPSEGDTPIVLSSVIDVCTFIDSLEDAVTGELLLVDSDGLARGALFIERGRICWAAARGMAQRLSDLLAQSANVDRTTMESFYTFCKKESVPLGESLVASGLVTPADLRSALLKHTTESLHALSGSDLEGIWMARGTGGYNAGFTFSTADLLSRTLAEDHGQLADLASAQLAEALTEGDWGAAFVAGPYPEPGPIAIFGPCPGKIAPVLRLGRWAWSSLDVACQARPDRGFVATLLGDGALVAWRSGSTILAGRTGAHGPARLFNRLARDRRRGYENGDL